MKIEIFKMATSEAWSLGIFLNRTLIVHIVIVGIYRTYQRINGLKATLHTSQEP